MYHKIFFCSLTSFYLIVYVLPDPFFFKKSIRWKSYFDVFIPVIDIMHFNMYYYTLCDKNHHSRCQSHSLLLLLLLLLPTSIYCIVHFVKSDQNGNVCLNLLKFTKMLTNNTKKLIWMKWRAWKINLFWLKWIHDFIKWKRSDFIELMYTNLYIISFMLDKVKSYGQMNWIKCYVYNEKPINVY